MTMFDSRHLPLPLNPSPSHPFICPSTDRILHHHSPFTGCARNYFPHLPSNTQGASAEPPKAHDTERETKKQRIQSAEARLFDPNDTTASPSPQPYTQTASPPHGQSPAQFRRTKPENWDSMSTNQKENWRRYHKMNK